jgi:Fe-S-cluster-containing dehydrogenase component
MKISRRNFLAGLAAASTAAILPARRAQAMVREDGWTTVIDLTRCDGCSHLGTPKCIESCRMANSGRFPEPDPAMLKDYWPQNFHDDWSGRKQVRDRLTPYNWTFVQRVQVEDESETAQLFIPRRCMHCLNPPCVKLCPFGTMKQDQDGPVHVDTRLCFGGAKCKAVCPWGVPQRQAGVGIYTHLDPLPIGGGVMYKCDLCRDRLVHGEKPACIDACPRHAMQIGRRPDMVRQANRLAAEYGGYIYGLTENGGTGTLYVSRVPFDLIDQALLRDSERSGPAMRLHQPSNMLDDHATLAKGALIAPVAGVIGALAAAIVNGKEREELGKGEEVGDA